MILLTLLILGGIIGGSAISIYWDNVRDWITRSARIVAEKIAGVVHGVKLFAKNIGEFYQEKSKHYSQNTQGAWEETVVTRKLSKNEIPSDILDKVSNRETDITREMELELS